MKKKLACAFYTMRLRYLINYVEPSKKVNQKIIKIHLKLNELEKQEDSHSEVLFLMPHTNGGGAI